MEIFPHTKEKLTYRWIIMVKTVSSAFREFNENIVNLLPSRTSIARSSRDWLIDNLNKLENKEDLKFPKVYKDKTIKFGSFARKTKIRELDDIDLMLCFNGSSATYSESGNNQYLIHTTESDSDILKSLSVDGRLNSRKLIERIKQSVASLPHYKSAEIHRRGEAATLQLDSYEWNFDIVPCFYTTSGFYLIPDGSGNWKATDPRIDQERVTTENQVKNGKLLQLIRTLKYWNNRKITHRIDSYLFENLIIEFSKSQKNGLSDNIGNNIRDFFSFLSTNILYNFNDPKGFQGNINQFNYIERHEISQKAKEIYQICNNAIYEEIYKKVEYSIQEWKKVFGSEFPDYG